jgi:phosphatidylinositol kinase/protein kinase (PI-3  family)
MCSLAPFCSLDDFSSDNDFGVRVVLIENAQRHLSKTRFLCSLRCKCREFECSVLKKIKGKFAKKNNSADHGLTPLSKKKREETIRCDDARSLMIKRFSCARFSGFDL